MKNIIAVLVASSAALIASSAYAQEDAVFAGPYVGVTAGASSLDANFVDGGEEFSYGTVNQTKASFVYGVTAGYNAAIGSNAIVGVEADFNGTSARVRHDFNDWESHLRQSNPWFATVRARAGLTVGNAMFYTTAGVAIVRNSNKAFRNAEAGCGDYSVDICSASTDVGLAVGAGTEIALNHKVSFKAEYLQVESGTQKYRSGSGSDDYEYVSFKNKQGIARVGFNYRF